MPHAGLEETTEVPYFIISSDCVEAAKTKDMVAFYLLFLLWGLVSSHSPEKVGDVFPIRFLSNGISDIKGTATPLGKSYVLTHPGATYIALHFAKLDFMEGDAIEVSDANGGQVYTLTGSGKGKGSPFWSQHIKGDTIVLNTLFASRGKNSFFEINQYAAGFEAFLETICGVDDKANAVCYASSFPTEYSNARPVARLLINGSTMCTGFLVSGSNHLLTNNHCINSTASAVNTDYEFMSEAPSCDSPNSQLAHRGNIISGATFIKTGTSLDYTLVQIDSGNPASLYGFLELEDQPAVTGGQIYIPQHALGKAKQLAIFSTHTADASDGFCHINSIGSSNGSFGCGGSASSNLFYFCDTEGGSSGSPVIATSTNKVVGLHKCGGCTNGNHGTSSYLIWNEVGAIIQPLLAPTPTSPSPAGSPNDSPTSFCGDGICDISKEDCLNCPADCNGVQNGSPASRFCCGCGGTNPVGCSNSACNTGGFFCDASTQCSAPTPVVASPVEAPVASPGESPPSCSVSGSRCLSGSECCSGVCKGNGTCK